MGIKRHRRRLSSGEERTYTYEVNGEERQSLGIETSSDSVSPPLYRAEEKSQITAALQAASSLLIIGESGAGKTTLAEAVAEELKEIGFPVAFVAPSTPKQALLSIANQLGAETETLEGKTMTTILLMESLGEFLNRNTSFLIFDNAHRVQTQIRCWLEELHDLGQPMLLLATHPPARDIFLKLPRIELQPLKDRQIREIMQEACQELGIQLNDATLAQLQQRCGGNPMLGKRVVREEYLQLAENAPDHTQWVDGTPYLIGFLMIFTIVRFIGLGLGSTSLYLIGGMLAVVVGIFRLLLFSLPKKSKRLGQ